MPDTLQLHSRVTVPCPCCGSSAATQVMADTVCHYRQIPGSYSFVRCNDCGLHYQNPRLSDEELGHCYASIQSLDDAKLASQSSNSPPVQEGWLRRWWRSLQDRWPALPFIQQGPVLDVGCNFGQFLDVLRDKGIAVEGLEFNPNAVAICRAKGHTVMQGDLSTAELSKEKYAAITLIHTLEHIGEPLPVLRKLREGLLPNGQLIIVVPYVQSMMRYWFGKHWHGWDAPFHLVHFDVPSITEVFRRSGYRLKQTVVRASVEDYTRSLNFKAGKHPRRLLTRMVLTPFFKIAQWCGQGSYMIAIAERDG